MTTIDPRAIPLPPHVIGLTTDQLIAVTVALAITGTEHGLDALDAIQEQTTLPTELMRKAKRQYRQARNRM